MDSRSQSWRSQLQCFLRTDCLELGVNPERAVSGTSKGCVPGAVPEVERRGTRNGRASRFFLLGVDEIGACINLLARVKTRGKGVHFSRRCTSHLDTHPDCPLSW